MSIVLSPFPDVMSDSYKNQHYCIYDKYLVCIKGTIIPPSFGNPVMKMMKYNITTNKFGIVEKMSEGQLKNQDTFVDAFYSHCIFDIENRRYDYSDEYEYEIYEHDGNRISNCIFNNKFYTFHSGTDRHDTGVFIYNPLTKRFDNTDITVVSNKFEGECLCDGYDVCEPCKNYTETFYTNRFQNLYKKEVTHACSSSSQIFLLYNEYTTDKVYSVLVSYDPSTDKMKEFKRFVGFGRISMLTNENGDKIYICMSDGIMTYDIPTATLQKTDINIGWIKFCGLYDNNIIIVAHEKIIKASLQDK